MAVLIASLFLASGSPPSLASDIIAGRNVYETHCISCHDAAGRGLVPQAPDFSRGETLMKSDIELVRSIKYGKKLMPGYEGILFEKDMLDVLAFVRSLWL